jgi:dienelactone hydrolase
MLLAGALAVPAGAADPVVPADYFAEPVGLPFDLQEIETKQEDGWHWREFRYTSIVYQGEAVRIHAIYAVPDGADAAHPVPAIIATHGADTGIRGTAGSYYWNALRTIVPKGYAVLFYDWDFRPSTDWNPATPDMVKRFSTYGKLDFTKTGYWSKEDDFRASLHYQAMIAARRGLTWLTAQPEVDAKKLGAWGASYGGIFTSMLAGIDDRIIAADPTVYTSDFGLKEEAYNMLPGGWTDADAQAWRVRFDSFLTLRAHHPTLLYTVGANDPTFRLTKAMRIFAAMNEPKHLLIGPNQNHGYWDLDQTVLFFDSALKGKMARPVVHLQSAKLAGREVVATASLVAEAPQKVEFFVAPAFELDPVRGWSALTSDTWKWTAVEGAKAADGTYSARWPLPVMRPRNNKQRLFTWDATDRLQPDPKELTPAVPTFSAEKLQGAVQVFVRVTDKYGAMECTPLAEPVLFSDPETIAEMLPAKGSDLPVLEAAVRVRQAATVAITPDVPAGQPRATLPGGLPEPAVGRGGYVLWNWQKNRPSETLTTAGVATPTVKLLAPFTATVKPDNFFQPNWANYQQSGFASFTIAGQPPADEPAARPWHGALPLPGTGVAEELALTVADDQEHRLTLVMPAAHAGSCTMRVSLRSAEGWTETVRYLHTADCDQYFQFRFRGNVTLRVEMTSQPEVHYETLVGPSALFLD